MARYNRIANELLYAACAQLDDGEYRKARAGSFGSIHALLNHLLLGDRIWMGRFEGGQKSTPPLDTVLYDQFEELRQARVSEDDRIWRFFATAEEAFLGSNLSYTNSLGKDCVTPAYGACAHLFNHQTHHRGQVHVMLSQTGVRPPSLDLHRVL
jgi:uncharacterized damage-inducible protein DinB